MDNIHLLVTAVTNQAALISKMMREHRGWYVFGDTRPGTPVERFTQDAENWQSYQKLFRV